jgi:hypothetical protein
VAGLTEAEFHQLKMMQHQQNHRDGGGGGDEIASSHFHSSVNSTHPIPFSI